MTLAIIVSEIRAINTPDGRTDGRTDGQNIFSSSRHADQEYIYFVGSPMTPYILFRVPKFAILSFDDCNMLPPFIFLQEIWG